MAPFHEDDPGGYGYKGPYYNWVPVSPDSQQFKPVFTWKADRLLLPKPHNCPNCGHRL